MGSKIDLAVAFLPNCPTLDSPANLESVVHTLEHVLGQVDWVVVDTLFGVAGELDVTKSPDSSVLVKRFESIMARLGCSLTVVHHDTKGNGGFFGSQVWYASVDAMDECKSSYLGPGVRGVTITNEKTKDEMRRPAVTLNARVEDLGLDDRGRRQSTLVLVADAQAAQKSGEGEGKEETRVDVALRILQGQKRCPSDWLAAHIVACENQGVEMTDGQRKSKENAVKTWLRRHATDKLAEAATKAGTAKTDPWEFNDPMLVKRNQVQAPD